MFGVQAGDRYEITLSGPDGRMLSRTEMEFTRNQTRRFAWIGKRVTGLGGRAFPPSLNAAVRDFLTFRSVNENFVGDIFKNQ